MAQLEAAVPASRHLDAERASARRLSRAAAALLALMLAACSGDPSGPSPMFRDDRPATVEAAEAGARRWAAAGLASYRFRSEASCFCPPEYRAPAIVTVRAGAVVSAVLVEDGASVPEEELSRYWTVDGVFALIFEAIDEQAVRISVSFDAVLGYPTELYIDRSEMIADEELGLTLSELEPVGAASVPP